jgi:hypothetical protein
MKPPSFADDLAPCANCGHPTEYRVKGAGVTPLCYLRAACKQPQPALSFTAQLERVRGDAQ